MSYLDLRGHQIWSVQYRPLFKPNAEKVVLLHGGLSATEDWDHAILPAIKRDFHVYGYDRTAHGRTKVREGFYHFDFQCDEAIAYLEDVVRGPAHLIGWSDGGIIALYVALKRPDLVKSIVAIGANYHYDCGAIHDVLTIEVSEDDKSKFASRSDQDPELLESIVRKAYEVWLTEPNLTLKDLGRIDAPTLILAGDDEPFTSEHTFSMYEALPNGRLAIIPGASHYLPKEKREQTQAAIKDFYRDLAAGRNFPMTRWPNRRKTQTQRLLGNS